MKVVVTRAAQGAARLVERLEAEGFEATTCPLIEIEPLEGPTLDLTEYDWLLLTSPVAVEQIFQRVRGPFPSVGVIGTGTAAALRDRGIEPTLVARRSTQEGLLEELPKPAGRVLFAGSAEARDVLTTGLGAEFVPLYRAIELRPPNFPDADLVLLASASAARALAAVRTDLPCVSIGPVTSAAARGAGLAVVAEAKTHDLDGLIDAVKLAASSPGPSSPC